MAALATLGRESFAIRAKAHLRDLLAPDPISTDDEALGSLVNWGMQLSDRLLIVQQVDVWRFLELFAHADLDFPTASRWEWLRLLLATLERTPADRLEDVYTELIVRAQQDLVT